MSEIIRNWISTRLGIILDFNLLSFGDIAKDGNLIAQLLCDYGILKYDLLDNISKTDDTEIAMVNLMYLHNYLKSVGIDSTEKTLHSIANSDGKAAIKLFYQLYLILHGKSKLHFITDKSLYVSHKIKRDTEFSKPTNTRITRKIEEDGVHALYNWHKNKYLELTEKCKEVRDKYLEQFKEEVKKWTTKQEKYDTKESEHILHKLEISDDDDVSKDKKKMDTLKGTCGVDQKQAGKFISELQKKNIKYTENRKAQLYLNKMLLNNLFRTLIEKQEEDFKQYTANKLLKQSYYEKQMATKLMEVRKQKQIILENRRFENEILQRRREEEFIDSLFHQQHNIAMANLRTEQERKRILELHKRLYAQKMKRKYKKHYKMCSEIVDDLLDLTIKTIDYKERYVIDVPERIWHEWLGLFVAEMQILDETENVEDILDETECEEREDELYLERCKQDELDEKDMMDYQNLEWQWNLEETEKLLSTSKTFINNGLNVLGYIVHKILLSKYPFPYSARIPELPPVKISACIIGIPDPTIIFILQKVLRKKGITVIDMPCAINCCLQAYLKETTYLPEIKDQTINDNTVKKDKKDKKDDKAKSAKGKKSNIKKEVIDPGIKAFEDKLTQTPKTFPGEKEKLSILADLGKLVHENLNLGLSLSSRLQASVFAEYLKSLKNLKGWILVNYPERIKDAITLELTLTGKLPIDEFLEEAGLDENDETEEEFYYDEDLLQLPYDKFVSTRLSKLVPNIKPVQFPTTSISYFTNFVTLYKKPKLFCESEQNFELPENHITALENLYTKFGCNYSIPYTNMKFEITDYEKILTNIIGDDAFNKDMYDEIIKAIDASEENNQTESNKKGGAVKQKSAVLNKKSELIKKSKKSKVNQIPIEEKENKFSNVFPDEEEVVEVVEDEIEPPLPGEPRWEYVNMPQPTEYVLILAGEWENIEEIYLNDFKQLLFLKRLCQNSLIPYVHNIDSHMTKFIERPDNKQEHLHKFQLAYNDITNDLRDDDEFKIELHCRINEFKCKLWDICAQRMRESEAERVRIINENWFTEQARTLINIFIKALQLELDRCYNTFQFLQEYYTCMANSTPLEIKINKTKISEFKNDDVNSFLINCYANIEATIENDPFTTSLQTTTDKAIKDCVNMYNEALSISKNFCNDFMDGKSKKDKKCDGQSEAFKNNIEAIIGEWECAVVGEYHRTNFRLQLLNCKGKLDIIELISYGENIFQEINSKLSKRYHDELNSVNTACLIFTKAVEASENIQPRLVFDGAQFYIDGKTLLEDDIPDIFKPAKEEVANLYFTISQLMNLTTILLDLAPSGSLPTKTFTFLLQDMAIQNVENPNDCLLPFYWHYMKPYDVGKTVNEIYGNVEYIYWKDFIIYNLELPFPTECELIDTRRQFREMDPDKLEFVNEAQFSCVQFWFERDMDDRKKKLVRQLLSTLFRHSDDKISYASLLLSFCKDYNPILGAAKAFALASGTLVCWDEIVGTNFIAIYQYQKYLKEQERLDAISAADSNITNKSVSGENESAVQQDFVDIEQKESIEGEVGSFASIMEEVVPEEIGIPSECAPLVYFLPLNIIIAIMTAALPWHSRVKCLEDNSLKEYLELTYESLRNEEFDNNVLAHQFLNCKPFKDLINANYKFVIRSPAQIVKSIIEMCTCKEYCDK